MKTDDLGFVLLKRGHLSVGLNSKIRQATEECFEVTNKKCESTDSCRFITVTNLHIISANHIISEALFLPEIKASPFYQMAIRRGGMQSFIVLS